MYVPRESKEERFYTRWPFRFLGPVLITYGDDVRKHEVNLSKQAISHILEIAGVEDIVKIQDVGKFSEHETLNRLQSFLESSYNPGRKQLDMGVLHREMGRLGYEPGYEDFFQKRKVAIILGEKLPHKEKGEVSTDLFYSGQPVNFLIGVGDDLEKRYCLSSLFRLRQGDPGVVDERIKQEIYHEAGHMFGLGHCDDETCGMCFPNSIPMDLDKQASERIKRENKPFCENCTEKLRRCLSFSTSKSRIIHLNAIWDLIKKRDQRVMPMLKDGRIIDFEVKMTYDKEKS